MIGRRFGRFRITAPLGRGGLATVWRARDELLGREVALKLLSEEVAESPSARQRFVHEARATAMLDHPGIVSIHEAGESDGRAYIAYSLIEGETVSARASQRLMPIAEALRIACAAAEALEHAHARGVVHRDVTGRNIMVARDGRVIVLDFGLAVAAGMSRLTTSGVGLGTVAYMAPEAALGPVADPRGDVYGLGVVLFEMLTGRFPFMGERSEIVIHCKLNEPPPAPSAFRPEVPPALDRVVLRALAREPGARYATAGEMLEDLRALRSEVESRAAAGGASAPSAEPAGKEPAAEPGVERPPLAASGAVTRPHPLYLAVLPFELPPERGASEDLRVHLEHFAEPLKAALARHGVRPIPAEPPAGATDRRAFARAIGANALLCGCATVAGSSLRVSWGIVDPESGVQWAGDVVDGSALLPFEVQDRLIASVARALGLPLAPLVEPGRPRPRDPAAADRMTQALRYLERYDHEPSVDGAIAILETLIATEGETAVTCAALARACLFKHQLTNENRWVGRAASVCERARGLAPESPEVMVAMGDLHTRAGRPAEAIDEYEHALACRPDSMEALLGLSRARQECGDVAGAEEASRRAVALDSGDWRGHFRLAGVLYTRGGYADCLPPLDQVVRLLPDNPRGWRLLGSVQFQLDRFEQAADAYRRSLAIQPSAYAYTSLGTVLYYMGENEEADHALERAAALTPADPLAWGNLGSARRWMSGYQERAREPLERAIGLMREHLALNPADGEGWNWLAGWLSNLGQHEEALEAIERALSLAPENLAVLSGAAQVYFLAGCREESLRKIREAITRGLGVRALRYSPALAPLREDPVFRQILEQAKPGTSPTPTHEAGGPR